MQSELRLQELIGTIAHFDEVLTMSARMAAATGDVQWEERYRDFEPKLDRAIKEAIQLVPEAYQGTGAVQTDAANVKLVEMENQAFDLVRKGQREAALELLLSEKYQEQKLIYAKGMAESASAMHERITTRLESYRQRVFLVGLIIAVSLLILIIAWFSVLVIVRRHYAERKQAEQALREVRGELENRVEERTAELKQEIAERENLQQEVVEAQKQAIRELSTPVIPIMERIIVMPLVGSIDSMRARDITRALLAGISEHRARVVILDITGVSVVDSGVANHLNKTIQAARLKGAQTIVTGISDAVAETIVDLGIDWSSITTLSDLQTGLVVALDNLGIRLSNK